MARFFHGESEMYLSPEESYERSRIAEETTGGESRAVVLFLPSARSNLLKYPRTQAKILLNSGLFDSSDLISVISHLRQVIELKLEGQPIFLPLLGSAPSSFADLAIWIASFSFLSSSSDNSPTS